MTTPHTGAVATGDDATVALVDSQAHAAAQDPADIVLAREARIEELKAALRQMLPAERDVLIRHESLGQPLSAVARALGITDAAAARHLERARAAVAAAATRRR